MDDRTLDKDEIARRVARRVARRGREIYERDIRGEVELEHEGGILVVDVGTGYHAFGEDQDEVFDQVEKNNPSGLFYLLRVGHPAVHRIGHSANTARRLIRTDEIRPGRHRHRLHRPPHAPATTTRRRSGFAITRVRRRDPGRWQHRNAADIPGTSALAG